jgi:hypothetical protein
MKGTKVPRAAPVTGSAEDVSAHRIHLVPLLATLLLMPAAIPAGAVDTSGVAAVTTQFAQALLSSGASPADSTQIVLTPLSSRPSPADSVRAKPLSPVTTLSVIDKPLDAGHALKTSFTRSASDSAGMGRITRYELLRKGPGDTTFTVAKSFPARQRSDKFTFEDGTVKPGKPYFYRVRAVAEEGAAAMSEVVGPVVPTRQWFMTNKVNTFIATAIFIALILGFINAARRGRSLFIRRIAGLDAIDEAIGRCTEMGKPTMYIPGLSTISDVATIASLNILGQVAKKIASYQARIVVPNRDPIVYPVTQDVVKEAFMEAGYPDNYRDEDIYFVTNDQFTYAAAVCGTMVREKPGANLLLGMFWAESLILAETGSSIGAIQIAGTDAVSQLPFFVTACDYTIIGEELYAASAYIGREPTLLGSVKGQDVTKIIVIALIVIGVLAMTAGVLIRGQGYDWITNILKIRGSGS